MRVTVRLSPACASAPAGPSARSTAGGPRVADVWPALELGDEPHGLAVAVNREYAGRDHALADGDEVAFIPPVSGGAFRLTEEPLDLAACVRRGAVRRGPGRSPSSLGTTRARSRGRDVQYLDYEAYPEMAEQVMAGIAGDLKARYELHDIAIHHRLGRVEIGGTSVVIAVSAPHRAIALAGVLRRDRHAEAVVVPLWKKCIPGGEEWIGRGS